MSYRGNRDDESAGSFATALAVAFIVIVIVIALALRGSS